MTILLFSVDRSGMTPKNGSAWTMSVTPVPVQASLLSEGPQLYPCSYSSRIVILSYMHNCPAPIFILDIDKRWNFPLYTAQRKDLPLYGWMSCIDPDIYYDAYVSSICFLPTLLLQFSVSSSRLVVWLVRIVIRWETRLGKLHHSWSNIKRFWVWILL